MDIVAILSIVYATNCATCGSGPGKVVEKCCIVTEVIQCNHQMENGRVIKFSLTNEVTQFRLRLNTEEKVSIPLLGTTNNVLIVPSKPRRLR